jgi:small subunit ribosomal protein S17
VDETAPEPALESETSAEPEPAAAPATEPASEPALETPAAGAAPEPALEPEAAPATEPAPAQPAKRARSRRHVPRHERRQRTGKAQAKKPAKRGERKPIVSLPKPESERGKRQERRGVVVSAAMDKTVVIKVDTLKAHRKYGKVMRRSKKFHAHDEANSAKVGDIVRIVETRPLSATKRWRVVEILEVAK